MNISAKYLDFLQEKTETGSDYAVSKLLGVSANRISNYRCGRSKFDDEMAVRVANALDIEPMEVIAAIKLEYCKEKEDAKMAGFWADTLKKTSATLSAAFLTIAMTIPNQAEANSFNITNVMTSFFDLTIYTLCRFLNLPLFLCRLCVITLTKFTDKIKGFFHPDVMTPTPAYT